MNGVLRLFAPIMDRPQPVTFNHVAFCVWMAFAVGLFVSLAATPLVRWLAHRNGWLDRPDGVRKRHLVPIPRIGGLGVYGGFFAAVAAAMICLPSDAHGGLGMARAMGHLLIAASLVMLVGLLDDVRGVRPIGKLAAQALAGVYLFVYGYRIALVTNPFGGNPIEFGWWALPVTVLWFVALSNAFNLIDGLDGLAAGVGLFATVTLGVSAVLNGRWTTVVILCALAGALLGFLKYNFNPASVFLGDSGSLFVGFVLAGLAIRSSMKASAVVALGAPLCALALPILDVVIATLRRLATGHRVFEADHDHIHHRLIRRGLSPRRAVASLYGVAAVGASLSLVTIGGNQQVIWGSLFVVALVAWAGMRELGYAEFGEFGKLLVRRYLPERRTVANNAALVNLRADLARAATGAQLWDVLVQALGPLGFHRVEMIVSPAFARLLGVNGQALSRHPFPVWHASSASPNRHPEWEWKVTVGGSETVATIIFTRLASEADLLFDPPYLVCAVHRGFEDFLGRSASSITCAGEAGLPHRALAPPRL